MKKYRLLIFILLVFSCINVYAYNWCRGGIGANSYDFCDAPVYLDPDKIGYGIYSSSGVSLCGDSVFNYCPSTLGETIDNNMFKNNDLVKIGFNHFTKYGEGIYVVDFSNGYNSNINSIYTNKYLINNDYYVDTFNQNVKVDRKDYILDSSGESITVIRAKIPVFNSSGGISSYICIFKFEEKVSRYQGVTINNPQKFINLFSGDVGDWPGYIVVDSASGVSGTEYAKLYSGSENNTSPKYGKAPDSTPELPTEEDPCAGANAISALVDKYLVKGLHVIAPIVFLVLTTLDFVKGTFSMDGKGLNKAMQNFLKRGLACILLFFAGNIISLLFDLAGIEKCETVDTNGDIYYAEGYFSD